MFKNVRQQGTVCAILTKRLRGSPYWTEKGDAEKVPRPTAAARSALKSGMSDGEVFMLRIAWAIWSCGDIPATKLDLGRLIFTLDSRNLAMVGNLLVALSARGSHAIDEWIRQYGADDCAWQVAR